MGEEWSLERGWVGVILLSLRRRREPMGERGSGVKVTTTGDGLGALHASRTIGVGLRAGGRTVNIV